MFMSAPAYVHVCTSLQNFIHLSQISVSYAILCEFSRLIVA